MPTCLEYWFILLWHTKKYKIYLSLYGYTELPGPELALTYFLERSFLCFLSTEMSGVCDKQYSPIMRPGVVVRAHVIPEMVMG